MKLVDFQRKKVLALEKVESVYDLLDGLVERERNKVESKFHFRRLNDPAGHCDYLSAALRHLQRVRGQRTTYCGVTMPQQRTEGTAC